MSERAPEERRCPYHVDDQRELWRLNCPACWDGTLRAARLADRRRVVEWLLTRDWMFDSYGEGWHACLNMDCPHGQPRLCADAILAELEGAAQSGSADGPEGK